MGSPREGWIKVNVDGAFSTNGSGGVGVIIRDHLGGVVLSSWRAIFNAASAEEVEALACLEGVRLAAAWERRNTILESDYETDKSTQDEER
jgi:ribonuclease HI